LNFQNPLAIDYGMKNAPHSGLLQLEAPHNSFGNNEPRLID
jgi:hypothetical protein